MDQVQAPPPLPSLPPVSSLPPAPGGRRFGSPGWDPRVLAQRSRASRAAKRAREGKPPAKPRRPANPKPTPPPPAQSSQSPGESLPSQPANGQWRDTQVLTVRARIERLLALLDTSTDPGDMARLASAVGTLEEVERRFSDRQLPPTVRSSQARRGGGAAGLMD